MRCTLNGTVTLCSALQKLNFDLEKWVMGLFNRFFIGRSVLSVLTVPAAGVLCSSCSFVYWRRADVV